MSIYNTGQQQSGVLYQADPSVVQHLNSVRDSLHHSCRPYVNHKVRVQTVDGLTHEGTIAGLDNKYLFLGVTVDNDAARGYYNPYTPYPSPGYNSNVILPLVLFELLVISLL